MENNRIIRSARTVGIGTGLSRVLGLVREILMAFVFGTSLAKSAFDVAFRIPNLFRRLFGEGALSAAFIPVFAETLTKQGIEDANRLAGRVAALLATTLSILVLGGLLVAYVLSHYAADGSRMAAVLPLLRIMLPYMLFICLVALCMAMLNARGHFWVPAFTPVLLNLVWIATLLVICPRFGTTPDERIFGVAWGILAAGVLQLAVQLPVLRRYGVRPAFSLSWRDPGVRRILGLMGPAALGMGVHQLNVCIDGFLALWAAGWAPAALTFAERLIYLPLGLFATSLGTVLLPAFSQQAAAEKRDQMLATMGMSISTLMLIMLPAAAGLGALAVPIVRFAYEWKGGVFDAESTVRTARAVMFYAPGLVVFSLNKVFVPAFYALQDMRTPVRTGVQCAVLNLVLNLVFVLTLPVEWKHTGLALATVLASGVQSALLVRALGARVGRLNWREIGTSVAKSAVAAFAMGISVFLFHAWFVRRLDPFGGGKLHQLLAVTLSISLGIGVYGILTMVLCRKELQRLRQKRAGRE